MLSFREMRKRGKVEGFACHHIIPVSVVQRRSLARAFGRARSAGFELEDFVANGMQLPTTDALADAFKLPLHRGPHRLYNEIVAERVALWADLDPFHLVVRMHQLQQELKRGLRRAPVSITTVNGMSDILFQDFCRLDTAIEKLVEMPIR
jgi:hypothetical protein